MTIESLKKYFSIKDGLIMDEFLGTEIEWKGQGLMLKQTSIIDKLTNMMKEFLTGTCEYNSPSKSGDKVIVPKDEEDIMDGVNQILYRSSVSSLLYIIRFTRPDISNQVR